MWGRRGRDRMIAEFTSTYAISTYHHQLCEFKFCSGEVYSALDITLCDKVCQWLAAGYSDFIHQVVLNTITLTLFDMWHDVMFQCFDIHDIKYISFYENLKQVIKQQMLTVYPIKTARITTSSNDRTTEDHEHNCINYCHWKIGTLLNRVRDNFCRPTIRDGKIN